MNLLCFVLGVIRERKMWITYLLGASFHIRYGIGATTDGVFQPSFLIHVNCEDWFWPHEGLLLDKNDCRTMGNCSGAAPYWARPSMHGAA